VRSSHGHARATISSAKLASIEALRAAKGEVGRLRLGFTVIAFYGALPLAVRNSGIAIPPWPSICSR
jgi:hypothetical protein